MNVLRFACGAESPPFDGSFEDWVLGEIKRMKGYALGRRRGDGRLRVVVFDLNGGLTMPRMPRTGSFAPCLGCPCSGEAGRKVLHGVPLDPRHGRRLIVTCYPREVSVDSQGGVKSPHPADATRKVASATPDVASATKGVAGATRGVAGVVHGKTCQRVPHGSLPGDWKRGWLHHESSNHPFECDGVSYCGRCHEALTE